MKKIVLFVGLFLIVACSESNEAQQICTNRLWNLSKTCQPGNATDCVYFATFGATAQAAGTIQISAETFEFYSALGNTSDGSICWDGPQD